MAAGIQVFNSSGDIIFDTSDYVMRVLGKLTINNGQSGSLSNSLITPSNFFVFPDNTNFDIPTDTTFQQDMPYFYVEGHTLYWDYLGTYGSGSGTYIYGVKI